MQLATLLVVGVRAVTLHSRVAAQSAAQLWHLISPEHCFGPDCCVHVGKMDGACTIETKCEQVASPHRLKHLEYSLICQKERSWQKHSFGYGGFDPVEQFVTNIQCDSCQAPRLSDYRFDVGLREDAGQIRQLVQSHVRRHRKIARLKEVWRKEPDKPPEKPGEPETKPEEVQSEAKPEEEPVEREGGGKKPEEESDEWISGATPEGMAAMKSGGLCDISAMKKSPCCAPLERANAILEPVLEREGPCAKMVQVELAKLVNARGTKEDDPICFLTTRLSSVALDVHRQLCSAVCKNELLQLASGLMTKVSPQAQRAGAQIFPPPFAHPRGLLQLPHAVRLALHHVGLPETTLLQAVEWIWARNNTGGMEGVPLESRNGPQYDKDTSERGSWNGPPYGMDTSERGSRNGPPYDMEKASKEAVGMVCSSKCAVKLMHAALSVMDVIHDMLVTPRFASAFEQWPAEVRLGAQYMKFAHPSIRPTVDAICTKNDDGKLCMTSWTLQHIQQDDLDTSLAGASMCETTCGFARANTHMSAKMGSEAAADIKSRTTRGSAQILGAPLTSRDLATYVHLRRFTGTSLGCGQQDTQYCVDFVASKEKREKNQVEVNAFFSACGDLVAENALCDSKCQAAIVAFHALYGCCARRVFVLSKSVKFWESADVMQDPFTEVETGYELALDTIATKCGHAEHNLRPCEYAVPMSASFTLPIPDGAGDETRKQVALLVRGCLADALSTDVSSVTVTAGVKNFKAQISTPSARENQRLQAKMSSMRSASDFSCPKVATHLRDAFPTLAVTLRFASNAPSTQQVEEKLRPVFPKAVRISVVPPKKNGATSFLIQGASNDAPYVANVLFKDVKNMESEASKVTPEQFSDNSSLIMQAFEGTQLDPASSRGEILTFVDSTSLSVESVQSLGEPFGPDGCVYVTRDDDGFCKIVTRHCDLQELRKYDNAFTCDTEDGTQKVHSFGHFEDIGSSEVFETNVTCVKCSVVQDVAASAKEVVAKSHAQRSANAWFALSFAIIMFFFLNTP